MKHQVIRKVRQTALLGPTVIPLFAVIPIPVANSFPSIDAYQQQSKSETAQAFNKRIYHRVQSRGHAHQHKSHAITPAYELKTTSSKEDIIFLNRLYCTSKVHLQDYYRREHLFELLSREADLLSALIFCANEFTEEELNEALIIYKKLERRCKDVLLAYNAFFEANFPVLAFGQLVPETQVPDNRVLLPSNRCHNGSSDKHRSSRNKKKKSSQYRKAALKNKKAQQNLFINEWISEEPLDDDIVTLADVYEANNHTSEMSVVEKAYQAFISSPCTIEAAWAIHDGTEFEHTEQLAEAYQLLSNYLAALSAEE